MIAALASALALADPRTFRTRTLLVDAVPFDVLVAFGRVWATAWEGGRLDEIEPWSLSVVRRIGVGPRPAGLAARLGDVWIGSGREETVDSFPAGPGAYLAFRAFGSMWVLSYAGNDVRRSNVRRG